MCVTIQSGEDADPKIGPTVSVGGGATRPLNATKTGRGLNKLTTYPPPDMPPPPFPLLFTSLSLVKPEP